MNENRLADYLGHMQQAALDACGFIEGLDKVEFLEDKRTQQAVITASADICVLGYDINSCR